MTTTVRHGHPADRYRLGYLDTLESESVSIIREAVAQATRPVLLFSGGKDSTVMVHLTRKAFFPQECPCPVLHVDTGHNFTEVMAYRDTIVATWGLRLLVASVQEAIESGRVTERSDGTRNPLQTRPLLDAIAAHCFDVVVGGGRRDEERSRAKERVFSLRDNNGRWNPYRQRPELWNIYNARHGPGEHIRVFPLSHWTELDIWRYIDRENLVLPSLYYAHEREVFCRKGMWLTAGSWGGPCSDEKICRMWVRYRTVGDMSCTGAIESRATNPCEVIAEIMASQVTERGASRADDRLSESAMEDRKIEGYF